MTGAVLAAADTTPNPSSVQPGLLGLAAFVLLAVALFFLWRSMNKQLKRVDEHFADLEPAGGDAQADRAVEDPAEPVVQPGDPAATDPD